MRAPADFQVAVIGVRDLAIVVEGRALLIAASVEAEQPEKAAGERFAAPPRSASPSPT